MMKAGPMSKLVQLRAKTDRELLAVIQTELKRAIILANVAATRESPLYQRAGKILDQIEKLLPTISGMDRMERSTLESAVKELRSALDLVSAQRVQQVAFSSAHGGPN